MNLPDKSAFAAHLGEPFEIRTSSGAPATLVLAEVSRTGEQPERPFALVFTAPEGPVLDQRTYALSHAALGAFELLLVPIGPAPGTRALQYEAVFN